MKTPLTHHELEEMLRKQGKVQPAKQFSYQPHPLPTSPLHRRRVLLTAQLALLLTALLTIPLAAHFHKMPSLIPTPLGDGTTQTPVLSQQTTDQDPLTPPETIPPATLPSTTDAPISYLPASYGMEHLKLNLMMPTDSTLQDAHSIQVLEATDYSVSNTYLSAKALAGGVKIVSAHYAKVNVSGTEHENCTQLFYNLVTDEFLCIDHRLLALFTSFDSYALPALEEWNLHCLDYDARCCLFWIQEGDCYYYILVDFAAQTVRKIDVPLYAPDIGFVSPDFSYLILREPSPNGSNEHCKVVSLINDTLLTPFGDAEVNGDPIFSADGRFFLMRRADLADNQWLVFDSLTGQVTECEGEFCYLSDTTVLTKTENGYLGYNCATGKQLSELGALPLALQSISVTQYTASVYQYTLKLYDPVSAKLVQKLESIAAFALSNDGRWLYYYKVGDDHLTLCDLTQKSSYALPLSEEFLKIVPETDEMLRYAITVSNDRRLVAISYTIEPKTPITESNLYRLEAQAFYQWMIEALEESENLLALVQQFENSRFADHPIVENTAADIYDDYVIWQVVYHYQPAVQGHHPIFYRKVLRVVEDYRNNTLTLYWGDSNPHWIPGVSDSDQLTDHTFENGQLYLRYSSHGADYTRTCQKLSAIGKTIGCTFDYGKCYDDTGKWSNTLAQQQICSYEYLKNTVVSAAWIEDADALDALLQILARNPRTGRANDRFYQTFAPAYRVQSIRLEDADGNLVYKGQLAITSRGKYYLITEWWFDCTPVVEISEADYTALMELFGGFLYESGLYKNVRLAGLDPNFQMASHIQTDTGMFSGYYLSCDGLDQAKALFDGGKTSDRKMIALLFQGYENSAALFARIAVEDLPSYEWEGISQDGRLVRFAAQNGKLLYLEIDDLLDSDDLG